MRLTFGFLFCALLSVATFQRSLVWESEKSLWLEAARISPDMPRPHLNLGLEYEKAGDYDAALTEFNQALLLSQATYRMKKHQLMSAASAESNIGLIFLTRGQWQDAIHRSNRALMYYPEIKTAYVNRGTAFLALGRCQEAVADYRQAGVVELPRC